ncbi:RAD21 [Auxenochlorella protothecoides x Auxenochlorella symbiontica]
MFYSTQILSRKGPLATIWIASHLNTRLKRAQVVDTSIAGSVDSVLNPEAPLALRLSGQLLLGIVRVYIRKLQFLESDAKEAVTGLQELETHAHVAEVRGGGRAPEVAITLPPLEALDLFDPEALFTLGGTLSRTSSSRRTSSAGSASLITADDVSEVWGPSSQGGAGGWYNPEATFEQVIPDDEMDRRFSIELERLRSQAAEAPRADKAADALYVDQGPDERGGGTYLHGGDETLDAAPSGFFDGLTPLKTPTSGPPSLPSAGPGSAPLPGMEGEHPRPHRLSDVLPPLDGTPGADAGGAQPHGPRGTPPGSQDRPARRREGSHAHARLRRKRVQLDVDASGRPATELPAAEMRALMLDHSSLLATRGGFVGTGAMTTVHEIDLSLADPAAPGSGCPGLAPALQALFARALSTQAPRHHFGAGMPGDAWMTHDELASEPAEARWPDGTQGPMEGEAGPTQGSQQLAAWEDAGAQGYEADMWQDDMGAASLTPASMGVRDVGEGTAAGILGGDPALPPLLESAPGSAPGTSGTSSGAGRPDGFTARTQAVLETLGARFATPDVGAKRRRGRDASDPGQATQLGFSALVAGRGRSEAARWFFELLVLQDRGHVRLTQEQAYGEIAVQPGMAAVAAGAAAGTPGRRPLGPRNAA